LIFIFLSFLKYICSTITSAGFTKDIKQTITTEAFFNIVIFLFFWRFILILTLLYVYDIQFLHCDCVCVLHVHVDHTVAKSYRLNLNLTRKQTRIADWTLLVRERLQTKRSVIENIVIYNDVSGDELADGLSPYLHATDSIQRQSCADVWWDVWRHVTLITSLCVLAAAVSRAISLQSVADGAWRSCRMHFLPRDAL